MGLREASVDTDIHHTWVPLKTAWKLQLVQNAVPIAPTGVGFIIPVLPHILQLSVWFQAQFKVMVLTFRTPYGLGSANHILASEPTHPIQSSSKALLQMSLSSEATCVATQEMAFSVMAPKLFNSLPKEVCLCLVIFYLQMKACLFGYSQKILLALFLGLLLHVYIFIELFYVLFKILF